VLKPINKQLTKEEKSYIPISKQIDFCYIVYHTVLSVPLPASETKYLILFTFLTYFIHHNLIFS